MSNIGNMKKHVKGPRNANTSRNPRLRPQVDKQVANEGVFANRRFTHTATAIVGCVVQVQVKNKGVYEGIFKTFSSKFEIVLEMAHKVDAQENNNSRNATSIPSRDRLLDSVIFKTCDIISLTAIDVDLDYAVRDNFTDSAIVGKMNGQCEPEKVLEPWVSDGGMELSLETGENSSNGWDPSEMFRTNTQKYNVQSSYDNSLQQYTTPLEKSNTKEYKKREEEAEKLASEIEKSDVYRQRIDLENLEGDEEKLYSAVVRPNETSSQLPASIGKNQKYRQQGRSRGGGHQSQHLPNRSPHSSRSPPHSVQLPSEDTRMNGDKHEIKEDKRSETLSPLSNKTSPVPEHRPAAVSPDSKPELSPSSPTTPVNSKVDRRNSTPRARDAQIQDLKDFSTNFKLTEEKEKEREREKSVEKEKEQAENSIEVQQDKTLEKNEDNEEKVEEILVKVKQSVLNPMAKEFVPNPPPKAKQHQPSQQIATPPRPRTQSPIIQPVQMQNQLYHPYMIPQTVVSMPAPAPTSQQQYRQPKRAVVSVPRGDYSAAPAVVQAATGQPLLAGPHSQYTVQYIQHMVPQVMPMPAVTPPGPRMPSQTNLHMVPNSHTSNVEPNGPPHPTQMFMTPAGPGPVPAHMNPHPSQHMSHPTPAHMGPPQVAQQQQNQQQNQMAHQSVGQHPAPSPVQHTQAQMHPSQAPPPSSGTPQPHGFNPQMGQQGHPPLQPSPHNPTSPQGMPHHMSIPYQLANHSHVQGNPQFTVQQTHQQTSHTMQSQGQNPHIHQPQPQFVMMPQPHHHGQVQHAHLQQQPQFQGHPMSAGPGPMPGQGHVIPQTGLPVLHNSNPNSVHHQSQIHHFMPQGMTAATLYSVSRKMAV
ncbi:hypothetical protein ScPMuIL_005935 [Solemya velum]